MWAEVAVNIKDRKKDFPLTYLVPETLEAKLAPGAMVEIPLGRRTALGFVVELTQKQPPAQLNIKEITRVLRPEPRNPGLVELAFKIRDYYGCFLYEAFETVFPPSVLLKPAPEKPLKNLVLVNPEETQELISQLERKAPRQAEILKLLAGCEGELTKEQLAESGLSHPAMKELLKKQKVEWRSFIPPKPQGLTITDQILLPEHPEFTGITEQIDLAIKGLKPAAFLLNYDRSRRADEFFLQLAENCLNQGQSLLMLIPDAGENPQRLALWQTRLKDRLVIYHSGLSPKERKAAWEKAEKTPSLAAIGSRGAVCLPLNHLGLIIVDREDDPSYKEEGSPRYHARQVAVMRAGVEKCPVLLASPAPRLESYYFKEKQQYQSLAWPREAEPPKLNIVKPKNYRDYPALSPYLLSALRAQTNRGNKSLLICYKRGFAGFLICESCGFIPLCHECQKPLNFHLNPPHLSCRNCRTDRTAPDTCPECGAYQFYFPAGGIQKVQQLLQEKFSPEELEGIRVINLSQIKTLDWENYSLCGLVGIDCLLALPDFRAPERAFQLLSRIRGELSAQTELIIDTKNSQHQIFAALQQNQPELFYLAELRERAEHQYPPFFHFVTLILYGTDLSQLEPLKEKILADLGKMAETSSFELSGADFSSGFKKSFSFRIFLKGKNGREITEKVRTYLLKHQLPGRWDVKFDVDPLSLI